MKILITGAKGQLGCAFKDVLSNNMPDLLDSVVFLSKHDFDITNFKSIKSHLIHHHYDFIINTAAYTNVDGAETNHDLAESVNHHGVKNLVQLTNSNTKVIHISTDYVFSGKTYCPYLETDNPNPISFYGETKLRGEQAILNSDNGIIIRTSWLFYYQGINFIRKILTAVQNRISQKTNLPLKVVTDQIGSPTFAEDLSYFIIDRIIKNEFTNTAPEIYHFTNSGITSWYDLAQITLKYANISYPIIPIMTKDYSTAAKRPFYSVLNLEKIQKTFGVTPRHWLDALIDLIQVGPENLILA